jgi:hypothetical protein
MLYRRAFDYFSWVSGRSHDRDENHSVVFEVSNGAKRNVPKGETSKCALPFVREILRIFLISMILGVLTLCEALTKLKAYEQKSQAG